MAKTRDVLIQELKDLHVKAQTLSVQILETFKAELQAQFPILAAKAVETVTGGTANGANGHANGNGKALLPVPKPSAAKARKRNRAAATVTSWTANREAKRVPNFVLEATGCKNKEEVLKRFGKDASFVQGADLPPEQALA